MEFTDLLKGLRNLDEPALDEFLRRYSPLILAHIRRKIKPQDADDVAQEFLYHILSTNLFNKFAGESEGVFCAYLFRSAGNFSLNWLKKNQYLQKDLQAQELDEIPVHARVSADTDPVVTELIRKESFERLDLAVRQLRDPYRKVIEYKLLDYSNAEIAEILSEPLGSVNSWYTRGLGQLREKLKDLHTKAAGNGIEI